MSRNTKILIGVVVIIAGITLCRFLVGALMLGSSIFYAQSSSSNLSEYFMTVSELLINKDNAIDKQLRISGAVIGESIEFDEGSGQLSFIIADVPADYETVGCRHNRQLVIRTRSLPSAFLFKYAPTAALQAESMSAFQPSRLAFPFSF